ncbi:GTP cyclohydrolase II [Sulfitobacter sp. M57]|uniref:GTP cyclohydrolase II n=1 Tax=unclassified Sulfitobacter TaxID=196795 RepID=UPI0023E27D4A|nr:MULTISPECIES: GTP cyclohydrolase II [unclassified Sulfitobacter]MDF3415339.1 GTP cyclohydrolase II [Sulfitobacter sp. KE5]MDF3422820.1 GTP cyclohydrolase II [Sulfitobacter sp. KE43]MDF3433885.1 GTP cyclohydrolase II [Sulfitobacter sp. KE42]MDF3459525.1 GTP cyclohydrolase II [Sulfitobacter sp. S74]MDF3463424.1 GTP cyclohydrolase II [Sulfitobacter sp. Ks18]
MSLAPDITEQLARARADLRMGVPVVMTGTAPALVMAAETLSAQRLADILALPGAPVLAITARRAETLKARVYDDDLARIALPNDASHAWIQSIADPAGDLQTPMKGPFACLRTGDAALHRTALILAKTARLLPAVVVLEMANAVEFGRENALTEINLARATAELSTRSVLHPVVQARLPMDVSEAGKLHVFRPENGGEEHYAIEVGRPDRNKPVLARLHSACFTGDVMGSLKCDCGPQLRSAMLQMGTEGQGVLLYLSQEGRGIGLANKMRAYSLQDQGFDTVEANHRLGFEDDERDFRIGSDILKSMGFSAVRLLTNNPRKVAMMEASGVKVTERVPLHVGENAHNTGYLATKAAKSGHLF